MRPNSSKPIVLVVEDEKEIIDFVDRTLARFGIEAILADSGAEGLTAFLHNSEIIDAILTDVNCDKGSSYDGPWMIQAIKKSGRRLPPVKFMTGDLGGNNLEALVDLSGHTVLPKPFMPAELISEMRLILPHPVQEVAYAPPAKVA